MQPALFELRGEFVQSLAVGGQGQVADTLAGQQANQGHDPRPIERLPAGEADFRQTEERLDLPDEPNDLGVAKQVGGGKAGCAAGGAQ